jgi:hypothetical protein
MFKNAVNNGRTHDIIYSLAIAAPAAIAQAKAANLPEIIGLSGHDVQRDGNLTGQWIRQNVTYKIDTFTDQNIKLPSALLRLKKGDCKSFSLLFLAIMEAAGHNCGFRFARYRNNGSFTHVYNICFDLKNNLYTFDTCLKDLKELKNFKEIKDMRVNYIAGAPMMINERTNKPTLRQLMTDDRYLSEPEFIGRKGRGKKFFGRVKNFVKKGVNLVKTVGIAPARGPFLVLVDVNFRGIARKLDEARKKNAAKVNEFWLKLGGDINVLNRAIDKGKNKKALLGQKGVNGATQTAYIGGDDSIMGIDDNEYLGEAISISAAITAASGIVIAVQKLFKSLGVKGKPGEGDETEGIDPNEPIVPGVEPGEDFFANDPASKEAASYAESGGAVKPKNIDKTPGASGMSFKPSPMLLIGGAAAIVGIVLLTRKK